MKAPHPAIPPQAMCRTRFPGHAVPLCDAPEGRVEAHGASIKWAEVAAIDGDVPTGAAGPALRVYPLQPGWQQPILERGAIAQCACFASQNADIVPGAKHRLVAAKTPRMSFTMDPQNELFGRQMANVPTPELHTRTLFEDLV